MSAEATPTFEVDDRDGGCAPRRTARLRPRGRLGLAYRYAVGPLHASVFEGRSATSATPPSSRRAARGAPA